MSRISQRLRLPALALVLMAAAACTSVPADELSVPLPSTTTTAAPASDDAPDPAPEAEAVPDIEALPPLDVDGTIAIGGLNGLVLADPADGSVLRNTDPIGPATQPTWSRDGSRAVSYIPSADGGSVVVASLDDEWSADARRSYFFFSWSGDGQYIAALGPGPQGTTLDILTPEGELATEGSIDTASFYLAWEPGGADLVVHLDDELALVPDPLDLATREPLGEPGQSFLAPAWIPGTRDIVIVDEADDGRLIRLNVDDGTRTDLGLVGGAAGLTVSPDGSRLFLTHSGPNVARGDDIQISDRAVQDEEESQSASELVLLDSGRRLPINDLLTLWAEWSPDGSALIMLQPGPGAGVWRVFDQNGARELGDVLATEVFFRNYLFFSWQFVESPRIWSPDGDAIVYAAIDDEGDGGIYVHPIDGRERQRVSNGNVAFWAPQPDGGAPSPA